MINLEDGAKIPVQGTIVKVLLHQRHDRGMSLEPFASRCVRRGDIHELATTTDHDDTSAGTRIDRVGFLGFVEIANGGVLDRGDEVRIAGQFIGRILGFDACHFPNHYNILIAVPQLQTGGTLGLESQAAAYFQAAPRHQ